MITVADRECYRLDVEVQKNRLHFLIRGDWTNPNNFTDWLPDLEKAIGQLKPGFTELIDWTVMRAITMTDAIVDHHKLAMKAGIKKAARIIDSDHFVVHQLEMVTQDTGFPIKVFYNRPEAETWLDE
jgi:hypothetical protein